MGGRGWEGQGVLRRLHICTVHLKLFALAQHEPCCSYHRPTVSGRYCNIGALSKWPLILWGWCCGWAAIGFLLLSSTLIANRNLYFLMLAYPLASLSFCSNALCFGIAYGFRYTWGRSLSTSNSWNSQLPPVILTTVAFLAHQFIGVSLVLIYTSWHGVLSIFMPTASKLGSAC